MQNKHYVSYDEIKVIDCTVDEAETTITWMRRDETVKVYTSDNTVVTKLKAKVKNNPQEYKVYEASKTVDGGVSGYFFEFPLKYLSFRGGSDPKAIESMRERLSSNK